MGAQPARGAIAATNTNDHLGMTPLGQVVRCGCSLQLKPQILHRLWHHWGETRPGIGLVTGQKQYPGAHCGESNNGVDGV